MTVAIALQVHDGVVLASDSAITLNDTTKAPPDNILNVYGHGNKIFNIVKGLPIGGAFYGMANIGSSSISTLIKDVRKRLSGDDKDKSIQGWKLNNNKYTIEDVAKRIREFLFEEHFLKLNPIPTNSQFGFFVAGYGAGAKLSEVWTFTINNGKCDPPSCVMGQGVSSCFVGGDPDAFTRIANGYSLALGPLLIQEGINPAVIAKVMKAAEKLSLNLVEAPMPIQDAIELAEFFVTTTATLAKFKRGAATVGGPTESAAITKHEGFRWVHRKHYFTRELNPGEKL
jgi:hypothetical protein